MRRVIMVVGLLGWWSALPLSAQEVALPWAAPSDSAGGQAPPSQAPVLVSQTRASACNEVGPVEAPPWETAWGLIALRAMPTGLKEAPNGLEYHPNFSIDADFNFWVWRSQGIYLFADMRLWGEKSEYGVTNANDSWYGTSKRELDLSGGAAWNYAGAWEARAFGYTDNNLNRGSDQVKPTGFTDGFGLENRYYLSPEYDKLGQTGFDVSRATFLSIGYYPTKVMVGNDGREFSPGMMLHAYLTYDLFDWPCYAFGDAQYISDRDFHPKLLLFDVGLAARPFSSHQQLEFRLGTENTADLEVHDMQSIGYVAVRYVF